MALIVIEAKKDSIFEEYLKDLKKKLEGHDFTKNPFYAKVHELNLQGENIIILDITPIYPNPIWIGIFLLMLITVFSGFHWSSWHLLPISILLCSLFWSSQFLYFIFQFTLRKKGYLNKIRRLKSDELIRGLLLS